MVVGIDEIIIDLLDNVLQRRDYIAVFVLTDVEYEAVFRSAVSSKRLLEDIGT